MSIFHGGKRGKMLGFGIKQWARNSSCILLLTLLLSFYAVCICKHEAVSCLNLRFELEGKEKRKCILDQ